MDFSEETINLVWNKGKTIPDFSSAVWRWDDFGRVMLRSAHGNRDHQYGWEIDHIVPVASNGSDALSNLRPLHWESNLARNRKA